MDFNVTNQLDAQVFVIDIPERLTSEISDDLKKLLRTMVHDEKYKIIMNLEKTKYMDSSGLGAIVSQIASVRSNKGDIRVANVQKFITELFEITHINQIIKTFNTVPLAVDSYKE